MQAEQPCGFGLVAARAVQCGGNVVALEEVRGLGKAQAGRDAGIAAGRFRRRHEDEREIAGFDGGVRTKEGKSLHQVSQFADVSRPLVCDQPLLGLRREFQASPAGVAAKLFQEVFGQDNHVVTAVAKRRDFYGDHGQAEEQVLAEFSGLHRVSQIVIGGGNDANVCVNGLRATDAVHDFFFEHAEQFGLAAG